VHHVIISGPLFYMSTTSSHFPSGGLCNTPRPAVGLFMAMLFFVCASYLMTLSVADLM